MNARVVSMEGVRHHAVVGLRPVGRVSSGDLKWEFRCDCGAIFQTSGYAVRSGKIKSCPTCGAERARRASITHGKTETPEFEIWCGIFTRCNNRNAKSYPRYGGRGITVCERWANFENFLADMGPRPSKDHSVERRDNDGNYEPGNCEWATDKVQGNNKSNNRLVTIDGVTRTIAQWADVSGLSYEAIYYRLHAGKHGQQLLAASDQLLRPIRRGSVEFNGVFDTYAGWGARTGIKASTIYMRIHTYGWPVARALTEGAKS